MMKRLLSVFLAALFTWTPLLAYAGSNWAQGNYYVVGVTNVDPANSGGATLLNNANIRYAVKFIPTRDGTIETFRFKNATITGTLDSDDVVCSVYDDDGDKPGTELDTTNTTDGAMANNGYGTCTGLNQAVTAWTPYWLVTRNAAASPGSNYWAGVVLTAAGLLISAPFASFQSMRAISTDAGSSWTVTTGCLGLFQVGFDDGTYEGFPILTNAVNYTTNTVYADREIGSKFVTDEDTHWNVIGGYMLAGKGGTPTGDIRLRIYDGEVLLATSNPINVARISTTATYLSFYFPDGPIEIIGEKTLRVVIGETTQTDTSSNYYFVKPYGMDTDASSDTLNGFNGTLELTYFDGTSWSEPDDDKVIPFGLFLSESNPYPTPESTGGGGFF